MLQVCLNKLTYLLFWLYACNVSVNTGIQYYSIWLIFSKWIFQTQVANSILRNLRAARSKIFFTLALKIRLINDQLFKDA